VMSLQRWCGG